jgi:hypothetical protein
MKRLVFTILIAVFCASCASTKILPKKEVEVKGVCGEKSRKIPVLFQAEL